jgi:hypothetical protein
LTIDDPLQFTVSLSEHKERGTPYRESGPAAVNTIIILISDGNVTHLILQLSKGLDTVKGVKHPSLSV